MAHQKSLTGVFFILQFASVLLFSCRNINADMQEVQETVPPGDARVWIASPVLFIMEATAGYTSFENHWSLTPSFVLYADGLVVRTDRFFHGRDRIWTVWQTTLTPAETCELLFEIEATGFFDFQQEEYDRPGVTDSGSTHFDAYAWRSNHISAYALSFYLDSLEGPTPSPIADVYSLLTEFKPASRTNYVPEQVALVIWPYESVIQAVEPVIWPFEEVNLPEVYSEVGEGFRVEILLEGSLARDIYAWFGVDWSRIVREGDQVYEVVIRPIFPLEIWEKPRGLMERTSFEDAPERKMTCLPNQDGGLERISVEQTPTPAGEDQ